MTPKQLFEEDGSLLDRIQRGDRHAIASLYDRHSSAVYSIAVCMLREKALAEQVVSDIFTEIWRRPDEFMQIRGSLPLSLALMHAIEQSKC